MLSLSALLICTAAALDVRPPSVPLVTHDPYFSIWSPADRLTDVWPTHWTGRPHAMQSMIRVRREGEAPRTYRLMGRDPRAVAALPQVSRTVSATNTNYAFSGDGVAVTLSFCSPLLPHDLDVFSRPATYITWDAKTTDGRTADIDIYFDVVGEIAVDSTDQKVTWSVEPFDGDGLRVAQIGSVDQRVLGRSGDDLRIDWGHAYLAAPKAVAVVAVRPAEQARDAFAAGKPLPEFAAPAPREARDEWPALTATMSMDDVGATPVSRWAVVAYDDQWSIRYFESDLRPYWRRNGMDARSMLAVAADQRDAVLAASRAFDSKLHDDLVRLGGQAYASLAELAYRQAIAANKLVADAQGKPLLFPKENFSNGCIATVDVIYPMAPLFLAMSPDLARAMLVPVLDYGSSPRWRFPFAPHDLGTYPHATGQVYGGGEKTQENQMPVEESANLLLLVAAVSRSEGSRDIIDDYWPTLTAWAEYLRAKGYDPEHQLCTDDFTGHLAHNVNLSAKAILAIGAYAWMLETRGETERARDWRTTAESFAARWMREAPDGEATKLAFDKPGTWSQKYNLVWDDVLGLNLFSREVKQREVAWYRKTQQPFGLPLDSRADFTKTDWTIWSACLSRDKADFEAIVEPIARNMSETPDRVPLCDWVKTREPRKVNMIARPVVGGFFMPILYDPATWSAWSSRGSRVAGPVSEWARIPITVPDASR